MTKSKQSKHPMAMNKAIIYLHGFNSASLDLDGNLLITKDKLRIMQQFCLEKNIRFFTPNVDYRDFQIIVESMLMVWKKFSDRGYDVLFMGSSMGGFASEYLAMKTGCKAIMINPAINSSELLAQFIGVTENYETGQPYRWDSSHCEQYRRYEQEMAANPAPIERIVLLDRADELIDTEKTRLKYDETATIVCFDGGSHSFEHMQEALPEVERAIFSE